LSSNVVELQVRGRGRRELPADVLVIASKGGLSIPVPTPVGALQTGDFVGIEYGGAWSASAAGMSALVERPLHGNEKRILAPSHMTAELAFLLGAYMAEGHTIRSNWSVILTNAVEGVLLRAQRAWMSEFGISARITRQPGRCTGLVASSKRLVEYMESLGCGSRAANKRVPQVIFDGTREHALAFLQGAALDAYVTHAHAAKWAICLESEKGIRELQDLVTRLGVINAQIPKYNRVYDKTYFELYAAGAQGQALCRMVPFMEPDKQQRALAYLAKSYGPGAADVIPGLEGSRLYAMVPAGKGGKNGGDGRKALRHLRDPRTTRVTRASVIRAAALGAEIPEWLQSVITRNIHFAPVLQTLQV
jgi:hypothetical protein